MRHTLLALAVIALLAPVSVRAQPMIQSQEGIALENQILALQQQVQQLNANGGSALGGGASPVPDQSNGAAPDNSIVTSLLTQVQQLQTQVQQLNGEVDTLQNQVNTQHDATEKEIADLRFQVTGSATPGAPPTPGSPATPSAPAAPGAPATLGKLPAAPMPVPIAIVPASPRLALHEGELAYEKGNYTTAEASARAVLAADKISPEGYQAQYLLAESLAAEGKSQDAAIAYDDEYNRSRTGTNAAGSLLGLANSLTDINQAAAACDTLASLNSQFPTPPPGLQPRINAASHRAHCS